MTHYEECFWEGNGFEELHKVMKNGTEFCKDFENVLADKAELENGYVKGLQKVLKKAKAASKRCVGTLEPTWGKLVALLEAECEAHRTLSSSLLTECSKALKTFTDQQIKSREPMETAVERSFKQHAEKLSKQMKSKKLAFKSCKDLETSWEQLKELKNSRPAGDKDAHKLEKSCRKMEESLMKVDREYRESNIKTEQARLSWEAAMYSCCKNNEALEQERLQQLQQLFNKYSELLNDSMPPVQEAAQDLTFTAAEISPEADVELACSTHGTGPNQPVQVLLDVYEEDIKNVMDDERRQTSLERKLQYMEQEIERQQKARSGVEQLAKVYEEQPDFVDEKGADDVNRQLTEADCMLNLLKANHYKLLSAHAEVSGGPRPSSQFADYINTASDKHGTRTTLVIPLEQIGYLQDDYQPASYERSPSTKVRGSKASIPPPNGTAAVGGGAEAGEWEEDDRVEEGFQQDDYSAQDGGGYSFVGECRVLYEYQANEADELNIKPDDIIQIIDKYDQEWWQGQLNDTVGIFPASYVEEI